ncbi:hypothetical protein [Sulfuricurvum sp.]|uniref:hypothetical protein n=1 Tax=Sulfuricurvum sp. TaxID=2025608 RepID=UPI00262F98B5|nr:hypothetical protein [Sulfuricurvum sp.]MDD2267434.1 hypothetical protein [Sulfuricurvum sp.]MDD2782844.1 hypothetical protein [Sulfuricurvum sp.]
MKMYAYRIKIGLYTVSAFTVIFFLFGGTFMSFSNLFGSYKEIWLRIGSAIHIMGVIGLLYLWKKKLCPLFNTTKAPMFLIFSSWYTSIPLFIIQDDEIIQEGYGTVEYDGHGAYLDGEPTIATHMIHFDPSIPHIYILLIASALFVWFWDDIKEEIIKSWCD